MSSEIPWPLGRLVTRPTTGFRGITIEVRSRAEAIEAHRLAMYWARYHRWGNNPGGAAVWLSIAGELRRWAGGRPPRRRRCDNDPYPTVIETFPRLIPRWTDDA